MRKVALFLLTVILAIAIAPTHAHSGGTDGKGGHFDRSTGEYHYHHGYPAHDHPNGECPYAKNKDTSNTNAATSKPKSSGSVKTTVISSSANKKIETDRYSKMGWVVLGGGFIAVLVIVFIVLLVSDAKSGGQSKNVENKSTTELNGVEEFNIPGSYTLGDSIKDDCAIFPIVVYTFFISAFAYFIVYRVLDVYEFREMAIACLCVWVITILFAILKRNKMSKIIQSLFNEYKDRESKLHNAEYQSGFYKKECGKLKEQNLALSEKVYDLSKTPSISNEEHVAKIQEIMYKYEAERRTSESLRKDLESAYNEIRFVKSKNVSPDTIAEMEKKNASLSRELASFQDAEFTHKYGILPDKVAQVPYKYCPKCGLRNDDDAVKCRECEYDFLSDSFVLRRVPAAVSYVHWMVDKYNTPFQRERRLRAMEVVIDRYEIATKTAYINESDGNSCMTTHRWCTCSDFTSRELPCKHMYALMMQDGVISMDVDENEWR